MAHTRSKSNSTLKQPLDSSKSKASTNGKPATATPTPEVRENAAFPVTPSRPATDNGEVDSRPVIVIHTRESVVSDHAARCLAKAEGLYQRGGELVRVLQMPAETLDGFERPPGPRSVILPQPQLRSLLTKHCNIVKTVTRDKGAAGAIDQVSIHPPAWLTADIFTKQLWDGVPHLRCIVDSPVLFKNGRILDGFGYDPTSHLYQAWNGGALQVPDKPTAKEIEDARELLLKPVAEFHFKDDAHRAGWLAACLTPFGRFCYSGPSPLFFFDANVRSAGKTLLVDIIFRIATGQSAPRATYSHETVEMRKIITSIASDGDRGVLFDNVSGPFGNKILDAALTSTAWKDRPMGKSSMPPLPLWTIFYATGNNAIFVADIGRRVCYIRLESPEEHPELRKGYQLDPVEEWVDQHRLELMRAALILLRAYQLAGCPDLGLEPWGSFKGWSDFVRSAVVFAGMADPGLTRLEVRQETDVRSASMRTLLAAWHDLPGQRVGMTAAKVFELVYSDTEAAKKYPLTDMRCAFDELMKEKEKESVSYLCRTERMRNYGGYRLERTNPNGRVAEWAVIRVETENSAWKNHPAHPSHPASPITQLQDGKDEQDDLEPREIFPDDNQWA